MISEPWTSSSEGGVVVNVGGTEQIKRQQTVIRSFMDRIIVYLQVGGQIIHGQFP